MSTSQNGWPVFTGSADLKPLPWITGRVRPGDVWTIFDHLCRRFDAEVEPIDPKASWGWAFRAVRGQTSGYSNHASATAVDLNAPDHPLGERHTFTRAQVNTIDAILDDLDGVVRWGGDYENRADEMHFEIVGTPDQVAAVAARIRGENDMTPEQEARIIGRIDQRALEIKRRIDTTREVLRVAINKGDQRVIDSLLAELEPIDKD